jgi:hypothetical protein
MQDREARRKVDIPCEVAGLGGGAEGRLRDLSFEGCRLLSPHFAFGGERLMISLNFPGSPPEMHVVAEARWSDVAPIRDCYLLGCRFVHSDQTREAVRNLVEAIATNRWPELGRQPGDETRILNKI